MASFLIIIGSAELLSDYLPYKDLSSWRIVTTWSGIFFVLFQAFYSGALTMFFSTSKQLPFTSLEEGLALYPEWELLHYAPTLPLVTKAKNSNNEDFKKWFQRYKEKKRSCLDSFECY